MSTVNTGSRTFLANQAISVYRAVVISNNGGVTYAGSGQIADGYALIDAASGDYLPVRTHFSGGTQKGVITSTPITIGDTVYAAVTGYVSTTGTITVGKSLTTTGNSANGTVIEFIPRSGVIA